MSQSTFALGLRSAHWLVAALLAAVLTGLQAASIPPGFGVTAAVQGSVTLHPADGSEAFEVGSGALVAPGDRLVTGASSGLQLLLSDESVFTLGADTDFVLEAFDYDPASGEGQINASIAKGTFKTVTGRTNETEPGSVKIGMPSATLVVRGTMLAGEAGGDEGDTAVLLGPGAGRDSKEKVGSFEVIPTANGQSAGEPGDEDDLIIVFRSRFAVTVLPDGTVRGPFECSQEACDQLLAALAGAGGATDSVAVVDPAGEAGDSGFDVRDLLAALAAEERATQRATDKTQNGAGNNPPISCTSPPGADGCSVPELMALMAASGIPLADIEEALDNLGIELDDDGDGDGDGDGDDGGGGGGGGVDERITQVADLEAIAGLSGRFTVEEIEMDNGGRFDFMFEFGQDQAGPVEVLFIGFLDIDTNGDRNGGVDDGEISFRAGDTAALNQLSLSFGLADEDTLTDRGGDRRGCFGDGCSASIVVRNAGDGAVAKFFDLSLNTGGGDDAFATPADPDTLVRPGGNNNFPQDAAATID